MWGGAAAEDWIAGWDGRQCVQSLIGRLASVDRPKPELAWKPSTFARVGRLLTLVICFAVSGVFYGQGTVNGYCNPLDVSIADPHVLKDGSTYYLYGTTEVGRGFSVFTSTDLVHWSRRGLCYQKTASSWAQRDFWAPEVVKVGSTFYLYFTGYNPTLDRRNICVATSTSPLGPFTDAPSPVLDASLSFIDGHPYHDPVSGKYYMYAVRTQNGPAKIMVTELANPPLSSVGALTQVMTVTQAWEGPWVEAPYIVRHNNHYYMMYSGSTFDVPGYAVGYATATNLTGPWTKSPNNPILRQTATVSGPGHNSAIRSPDGSELFMAYHTHLTFAGGGARQLAIDRLVFTPQSGQPDRLSVPSGGPTSGIQPLPSGAAPRLLAASDEFSAVQLDRSRWNVFGEEPTRWQLVSGQLEIETRPGDIHTDNRDAKNIFLQHMPAGDFDIETQVTFTPQQNFEQAFLVLWGDQSNYVRFSLVYADGAKLETSVEKAGSFSSLLTPYSMGSTVQLRIERRGTSCVCYAARPGFSGWTQIGQIMTLNPAEMQAGLGAISSISGATRTARFDYFRVSNPSGVDDWQLY